MVKILVVEDEVSLVETLQYNLKREGYEVVVAMDGPEALVVARREKPDLILLDLMLPRMDGLEVCRVLRQEMNVPVLMLTAKADEVDKIVGLEVGADDYMTKPFSMRELLARVKALLRRVRLSREESTGGGPGVTAERLVFNDLVIDLRRREVLLGDRSVALAPKEYDLLVFLARHRGMVLSRDTIMAQVWGWDYAGGSRTVDVHMRWLREKIEANPASPVRLVTVRGAGYRFEG